MTIFLLALLNGLSFGSILFLFASSLSLILGVMGILNLTHGALYMIGAYVGWTVAVQFGLSYWLATLVGGVAAGLVGLIIERGLLQRLYKQLSEQVLLCFGLIYVLTNITQWIYGPETKPPFTAPLLSGSFDLGGWAYPHSRIAIILIGLVLAAGLWWLQDKTKVGAILRAGMDDKETTTGLGINLSRVNFAVFSLGAFIAGFAGVIGAQMIGASLNLGMNVLVLALVVVVIGGLGSVQGALLGGIIIGCIDSIGKTYFPELAMFTIYFAMMVMLLVRPSGLFGRGT